jgi:hypothetical protein
MKRLIIIVLLAIAAWQGYGQYQSRRAAKAVLCGGDVLSQELPWRQVGREQ